MPKKQARPQDMEKLSKNGGEGPVKGRYRALSALTIAVVMLGAGACSMVGPNYIRPEIPLSSKWISPYKEGVTRDEADPRVLASWWMTMEDPTLSALIDRAALRNLNLKQAQARLRESRARWGVARANLFPTVDASGSLASSGAGRDVNPNNVGDLYRVGFDATWEIDVFGGIRRSVEAASADVRANVENLRDVLVVLLAEVALNYIDGRTYQARLAVAEANVETQEETWQLVQWRCEAGLTDELAVQQALYNLESTRSQIPTLRTGIEEAMNRVAVLLGEQPGSVRAEMEEVQPIPTVPENVAVGVPADVLRQRPDVRKAEALLAAETARIGVATAELYPKLVLAGYIASESSAAGDLFSMASRIFSYGPRITLPIFNAGSVKRKIDVQTAIQEQALIQYESSVLTALEEVENAIVAFGQEQQRRNSLGETSRAAQLAATLAEHKYNAGLSDFTGVLDAQRALRAYQDQMALSEGAVASNLVRLYKALGGGWTALMPEQTATSGDHGEEK